MIMYMISHENVYECDWNGLEVDGLDGMELEGD